MQQQIDDIVQVGGDQSVNVLADIMIINDAQLLHFKAVLGVTDRDSGMLVWHAALDVVDR